MGGGHIIFLDMENIIQVGYFHFLFADICRKLSDKNPQLRFGSGAAINLKFGVRRGSSSTYGV
jgi:hypothetical protein